MAAAAYGELPTKILAHIPLEKRLRNTLEEFLLKKRE
jgi:hypothetical protein